MSADVTGRLVLLDQWNWRAALRVRVSDEQLPMVADHQPVALVVLAKAYVQAGGSRWEPLAFVEADGAVVAVLALAHTGDVAEVRNFAVDVSRQGKGVGTAVMHAVFEWCREQGSTTVELTVNPANEVARRMYDRVGFEPTGAIREGEPVLSISLA